tara:strand:- start:122 stop:751 length:630 start_codon:yes stop_codon:yes gene_type:complete
MSGNIIGTKSKSGRILGKAGVQISNRGSSDGLPHIGIRKNPVAGENVGIQGDRSDLNSSAFTIRKADGTTYLQCRNDGGIYTLSGGITGSTSDVRFKKNIKTLENCLEKLLKLNPVSYDWKEAKNDIRGKVGFIAQEVEKIDPSWVVQGNCPEGEEHRVTEEEPVMTLNMNGVWLTAHIVKAIQELSAENTELKTKLDALETRVTALEG